MDVESARLLADYVDGNSDAATDIYHKYINRLIALAKRRLSNKMLPDIDPEAIADSALFGVLAKAREDQIVLKRSGDLWRVLAGFTVIKTKKSIEYFQADKRNREHLEAGSVWIQTAVNGDPTPEQVAIVLDILDRYLERSSSRDRMILELRLQGESVGDIAEELKRHADQLGQQAANLSEATIRRVLRDAKRDLRAMLFED